jgi:mortality factor 4-like protein 1
MPASAMTFKENESVYAHHGPLLFKAQVLEKTERTTGGGAGVAPTKVRLYRVHYTGWDAHWDEWVPEGLLLRDDARAEEQQKQLIREFKRAHGKRKAQEGGAGGSAGDGGAGAAASASSDGSAGLADGNGKKAKGGVEQGDEALAADIREQLRLPQNLKLKLVEDWERISREKKLVPLPRAPSIETLLTDFVTTKSKRSTHERLYTEVCDGIRVYFNQVRPRPSICKPPFISLHL